MLDDFGGLEQGRLVGDLVVQGEEGRFCVVVRVMGNAVHGKGFEFRGLTIFNLIYYILDPLYTCNGNNYVNIYKYHYVFGLVPAMPTSCFSILLLYSE